MLWVPFNNKGINPYARNGKGVNSPFGFIILRSLLIRLLLVIELINVFVIESIHFATLQESYVEPH